MLSSAQRRERRTARKRADTMPKSIHEWIDMWFAAVPYDALLVIKENGVVIGTVRRQNVDSRSGPDLYLFLKESAEFGFGNYSISARYDGAFRGEHLHCEVGEPDQWRRGSSRAETRAIVDAEGARRERQEHYKRDPLGAMVKVLVEQGVFPGSGHTGASPKQGGIPEEHVRAMAETLRDASPEDFRRCCNYLRDEFPPAVVEAVFSAYKLLETQTS
jgi:hypothetical protein